MESKKHGVQNKQTGLIEESFDNLYDATKKCDELNGKYANASREDLKDFKTVFIVDDKIYDSEREYINA